ncbi:MAG: metallophosphoesterase [Saprospiraceae bacterium]
MRSVIFLSVLLLVFGSVGYYIYLRFSQSIFNSNYSPWAYTIIYWLLVGSLFAGYILQTFSISVVSETLVRIGSVIIGILAYVLIVIVFFDIIRLVNHYIPFFPDFIKENYVGFKFKLGIISIIIICTLVLYGLYHAKDTKIVNLSIEVNKKSPISDSIRIVALSDIHLGTIINHKNIDNLFEKINNINPDLILIGGDMVDNSFKVAAHYKLLERFKELHPKYGIYACLGNHDYISNSYQHIEKFETNNINILRDSAVLIDDKFYVVGRDDISYNSLSISKRKTLNQLLDGLDVSKPIILLDHQPYNLENVAKYPIDFQFSGHTHKGQFFPFSLITKWIFEKDYGFIKKGNTNFYISSGFGNAVSPIRIGTQSEIVNIVIKSTK